MSDTLKDVLDLLHSELARSLLKRVQSGEASASDLNVARQFLKDNNIDSSAKHDPHLAALAAAASHLDEDDVQSGPLH
ncbi:hypothetical protein [Stutzerimonas stutzeri]|uniref:hypothetical protein n=1 Tax=Stutzerimonas stutzeri TaxID=316 RepID=UPI0002F93642|nr:hypothetical protein [Stutzerimonas stutzeri]